MFLQSSVLKNATLLPSAALPLRRSNFPYRRRRCASSPTVAIERDESKQYEVDREKAQKALRQLDEQLQSLAQQPPPVSRRRNPSSAPLPDSDAERNTSSEMIPKEELPEISTSYLAYSAVALLILTIFYNVVFSLFIKPSIDGPEQAVRIERVPLNEDVKPSTDRTTPLPELIRND